MRKQAQAIASHRQKGRFNMGHFFMKINRRIPPAWRMETGGWRAKPECPHTGAQTGVTAAKMPDKRTQVFGTTSQKTHADKPQTPMWRMRVILPPRAIRPPV
ncbi:hypothetical protein [Paraburkholderia sp. J94]|uniref:hypothetical protein n=1 Tax=Paraburkholderia sp. J94 TaxID=2805441 RepID=UPI002AB27819|nr:hypothetical protein [Paraburkholderia sp. J94]